MYDDEIHFRNCNLNGFGRFDSVALTFDLVTPKCIEFLCYSGWMCGPDLRRVGQGILALLNGNSFGTSDHGDLDI